MSNLPHVEDQLISIVIDSAELEGQLTVPEKASGIVLFAHGSGSSRHSPRNRFVAQALHEGGLATLLIDLLTSEEERIDLRTRELRFDLRLLARRLVVASEWIRTHPSTAGLKIGYFGASTGAGAALIAAAELPESVGAVVSRGGRPDLAGSWLARVETPTLLIVGGEDHLVIELNRNAMTKLRCARKLEIVAGATHLFEEPGALEAAGRLARNWCEHHLTGKGIT